MNDAEEQSGDTRRSVQFSTEEHPDGGRPPTESPPPRRDAEDQHPQERRPPVENQLFQRNRRPIWCILFVLIAVAVTAVVCCWLLPAWKNRPKGTQDEQDFAKLRIVQNIDRRITKFALRYRTKVISLSTGDSITGRELSELESKIAKFKDQRKKRWELSQEEDKLNKKREQIVSTLEELSSSISKESSESTLEIEARRNQAHIDLDKTDAEISAISREITTFKENFDRVAEELDPPDPPAPPSSPDPPATADPNSTDPNSTDPNS